MADRSDRTVLVAGATGTQGGAVARELLRRGYTVHGLTRSPGSEPAKALSEEGAEMVEGDMDDRSRLDELMAGVWGVFSVQDFWEVGYEAEVRQGKNMADAAKAAGVEQFVYTSVASAWNDTGLSHFDSKWEVEEHIREIDQAYTILRPVFFMQNFEGMREMILGGKLAFPLKPATRLQMVNVYDIGAFAGMAFDAPDAFGGRELDLAGDELSMAELAETFRDITGAPVEYIQVGWDDFREQMGSEYEEMMRWFEEVGYEADIPALRTMHPQLTRFEQYLRSHGWEGAGRAGATG